MRGRPRAYEYSVTAEGKMRRRVVQLELPGAEASAKQLAASRGDMLRTKAAQEAPGPLFAERFDDTLNLFEGR